MKVMNKKPRYIFSKDPSGNYNHQVEVSFNGERLFAFWLPFHEVKDGETKWEACDRIIKEGGFEDRMDLFKYLKKS